MQISGSNLPLPGKAAVVWPQRKKGADTVPLLGKQDDQTRKAAFPLGQKKKQTKLRAGFGNNTVSSPASAVRTLGENFKKARQLVPSLETIQEKARERAAELQKQQQKKQGEKAATPAMKAPRPAVDLYGERVRFEASARSQAGEFLQSINSAVTAARAYTQQGSYPGGRQESNGGSFQVGTERVPVTRSQKFPHINISV